MPRIVEAREFSVEELFVGMETGFQLASDIAGRQKLINELGLVVQSGSVTIPYDILGGCEAELSENAEAALKSRHLQELELETVRHDFKLLKTQLLTRVGGAIVQVACEWPGRAWGVCRTRGKYGERTRTKQMIDESVRGVIIGLNLKDSVLELENRQYNYDRAEYIEVPLLDRFGSRRANVESCMPIRRDRISERAVKELERELGFNPLVHSSLERGIINP